MIWTAGRHPVRKATFVAIALSLFVLVMTCLFWAVLTRGETFGDRDLARFFHPSKSIIAPLARATGGIPTWNPLSASGQPFAANPQHEIFWPLTALFFFLPFELAYRLELLLPLPFAVAGMFALLRTLRRSRGAALFGALAWGFGGYQLSLLNLPPILFAVAPLPWTLMFAVRLFRRPRALEVVGLALGFALQCLAGEPTTIIMTVPLCVAAALSPPGRSRPRAWLGLAGGLALGIALGAAALLPAARHAAKTDRADGLPAEVALEWSMPPVRILEAFSPSVTGHIDARHPELLWGRTLFEPRDTPYYFSLYQGLPVALLAIFGMVVRRRVLWPWTVMAVGGILLALGRHLPLWPALRNLPLLSGIRFPEKFILLTILPCVVASAFGFEHAILGPPRCRRPVGRALLLFALLGALAAGGILLATRGAPVAPPVRLALADAGRLVVVALVTLAVVRYLRPLGRSRQAIALCAVLALDLALAGRGTVHTGPRSVLFAGPQALHPLVESEREELLFNEAAWHPELSNVKGIANPPIPASWGIATTFEQDFDLTLLRWSNRATSLFWQAAGDPVSKTSLLLRRGVTAVFRFKPGAKRVGNLVVGPDGPDPFELLRNDNAQPFVFPAERVEIIAGEPTWLEAVRRLGPEVRGTAMVEWSELTGFRGPPSPAEVRIVRRTPTAIALAVEAKGPNDTFLAVNQTWDEGWKASLDGVPTRWLRCDISLSGLVVPPGAHRIAIEYADPSIETGLWISLFASLAMLTTIVVGARRRRDEKGA